MPGRPDHPAHSVLLPSGRSVPVTYVEEDRRADPEHSLECCGACGGMRVHPLAWEQVAERHWQITLRCPDCRSEATAVFDEDVVRRFDEALDRAAAEATAELASLERANMTEYAERFAAALHAGHLLPDDF
jgi:hypothetical protein